MNLYLFDVLAIPMLNIINLMSYFINKFTFPVPVGDYNNAFY